MTFRNTVVQRFNSIDSSNALRAQLDVTREKQLPAPTSPAQVTFDYPNPRGPTYPSDLRTFLQGPTPASPLSLLAVANQYDWPNPVLRTSTPNIYYGSQSTFLGTAVSTNSLTFNQVYDNPVRKPWDGNLYSFTQNIAPTNPIPANVTNWPNPPGPIFSNEFRNHLNKGFNELEAGIVQVPAEANYDWPVPKGYTYSSDLRTFLQNTNQSLKGLAPVPLIPFDWPNPVIAKWTPAPVVFTNALQVLGLAPPFFKTDWPNPVLDKIPSDRYSFLNRSENLLGFISPPLNQTEWPNPKGYIFPSDLRFWFQGIIAAEDTPPPTNYDQPNPTLGKWSPSNLTFISGISRELQNVVNTPAPTTYDRPNPAGYVPAIVVKTGESYAIPLTLLTFVPPVTTGQHNRYFFADMGSMWSNR